MIFLKGTARSASVRGPFAQSLLCSPEGAPKWEQGQETANPHWSSNTQGGWGRAGGWEPWVGRPQHSPTPTAGKLGAPTSGGGGAAMLFHRHSNQIITPSGKSEKFVRRYCYALRDERKIRFLFVIFSYVGCKHKRLKIHIPSCKIWSKLWGSPKASGVHCSSRATRRRWEWALEPVPRFKSSFPPSSCDQAKNFLAAPQSL